LAANCTQSLLHYLVFEAMVTITALILIYVYRIRTHTYVY
jgi:hypothetical protein